MDKILLALAIARSWLTPARRKAIYYVLSAVLAAAATFGWIGTEQVEGILSQIDKLLGSLALILAATNVEKAPDAQD